jgi:hypothetical protein
MRKPQAVKHVRANLREELLPIEDILEFNFLVINLERRTVLRPGFPVIVDACGGDVGVAKPLLHFGDVGLIKSSAA